MWIQVLLGVGVLAFSLYRCYHIWSRRSEERQLKLLLRGQKTHLDQRVLVCVNPVSGSGRSKRIYEQFLKLLLQDKGYKITELETQGPNDAWARCRDYQSKIDSGHLAPFDLVLSCGGDGQMWEVINGFMGSSFSKKTIGQQPLFGVVPSGTSNGLFTSLHPEQRRGTLRERTLFTLSTAGELVGRQENHHGRKQLDVDLMEIEIGKCYSLTRFEASARDLIVAHQSSRCIASMTVSIGLIAVMDELLEINLRKFPLKDLIAPLTAITRLPSYHARLRYTTVSGENAEIEDDFMGITVSNLPWIASDAQFSPDSKYNDGVLVLAYMLRSRCQGRINLVSSFLKVEEGKHIDKESGWELRTISHFEIDPLDSGAMVDMDGIFLGSCAVRGRVSQRKAAFV